MLSVPSTWTDFLVKVVKGPSGYQLIGHHVLIEEISWPISINMYLVLRTDSSLPLSGERGFHLDLNDLKVF